MAPKGAGDSGRSRHAGNNASDGRRQDNAAGTAARPQTALAGYAFLPGTVWLVEEGSDLSVQVQWEPVEIRYVDLRAGVNDAVSGLPLEATDIILATRFARRRDIKKAVRALLALDVRALTELDFRDGVARRTHRSNPAHSAPWRFR